MSARIRLAAPETVAHGERETLHKPVFGLFRMEEEIQGGMGMSKLQLSLACSVYDRTRPILEGRVVCEGIDLLTIPGLQPERQWLLSRQHAYDICESSLSSYLMARNRGFPYIALPIFTHRKFRHGHIFIRTQAGIERPSDLNGRRVGLRTFQATAGLWARGILSEHYDVELSSIEWWTHDTDDIEFTPRPGWKIQRLPVDQDMEEMFLQGELDGLIYPRVPRLYGKTDTMQRLFPDYQQEEEQYFQRTGIFPIMHVLVVREDLLRRHPWVAMSLMTGFTEAKRLAYADRINARDLSCAWTEALIEHERAVLGDDPYPYNVEDNLKTLETLIRYSHEQGLIDRILSVEELFFQAGDLHYQPRYI